MDFGLSRIVEMFEDRFGRFAATALIALIGLALACVSIKTIAEVAVWPVISLVRDIATRHPVSLESILSRNDFTGWNVAAVILTNVSIMVILVANIINYNINKKITMDIDAIGDKLKKVGAMLDSAEVTNPPAASPPSRVPPVLPPGK
jgi:hypothetical protein